MSSFNSGLKGQLLNAGEKMMGLEQTYVIGYIPHDAGSELQEDLLQIDCFRSLNRGVQSFLRVQNERRKDVVYKRLQLSVTEESKTGFALDSP